MTRWLVLALPLVLACGGSTPSASYATPAVFPEGSSNELDVTYRDHAPLRTLEGKAIKATRGALKEAEALRRARLEQERLEKAAASQVAEALADSRVVVAARAAEEGKLFGSIGARNVAEAITSYTGVAVDPQTIMLAGPIKEIGLHTITLRPHAEVEFTLTLDVIPA